jgi:hypothetical protein
MLSQEKEFDADLTGSLKDVARAYEDGSSVMRGSQLVNDAKKGSLTARDIVRTTDS